LTKALMPAAEAGDVKAAAALVNVINRQAKLWGLDAPTRIEGGDAYGLSAMSEGELLDRAKALGIKVD
jgi:hypothetical protein